MGAWADYSCTSEGFVGTTMTYSCRCPDGSKVTGQIIAPWDDASLNADVLRTIEQCSQPPTEAKGKIIAHNINKLPCPDCGEAKEGQEIEVIMGMKNMGNARGEFRFYIYDQDGNELSKEPDFTYKNINAGDTWGVHKTLTTNLNFNMLNKTLNGRVELRRQI